MFAIAVGTFLATLLLLIFNRINETIIALAGALLIVTTGILDWHEAILSIEWETITLLLGLMMTVSIAQHSGIFSWFNVKIAQKSKGNPLTVFFLFCTITAIASTVLASATVVLLIVPIAIALSEGLSLNTKLLVIAIAIFANIGGALTLIGDPPNTLIGVQAKLTFMDFIYNLSAPIVVTSIIIGVLATIFYWKDLHPISKNIPKLFASNLIIRRISYQFSNKEMDRYFIITTCTIIFLTITAFILQPQLGWTMGTIGMASGTILSLLLYKKLHFHDVLKDVEWNSLLFFAGLFVQIGALNKVGFTEMIANFIASFSDNFLVLLLVILWGIGLTSSVVNTTPLVALMIPLIMTIQEKMTGEPNLDLLWWSLALGACLGANGTILGSPGGILLVNQAKKQGIKINFMDYFKIGMPATIISLIISSIYLIIRVNL